MSINIEKIKIQRLFDTFDIEIPIIDNTLILVGENGSGKSTIINLIYYVLTSQWKRLTELPFQSCCISIDSEEYLISKNDIASYIDKREGMSNGVLRFLKRRIPEKNLDILISEIVQKSPEHWLTEQGRKDLKDLKEKYPSIPYVALRDLSREEQIYPQNNNAEDERLSSLERLMEVLSTSQEEQVLFLPTYRRIEKELSDIVPGLNPDNEISEYHYKNYDFKKDMTYVELVEFGMKDVKNTFKSTLKKLDEEFRYELNKFTGSHLHTILQRLYENVDISVLIGDKVDNAIDLMLSRIGNDILSEDDQKKLRTLLDTLLDDVKSSQELTVEQRISAHFLTGLLGLHKKQQEREIPVRNLVSLVNQYLGKKRLVFDSKTFNLTIRRTDTQNDCQIPLHGLSSGEKQIVSLFSHIFLSGYKQYFIVIDEPELSISLPWQRRFLQDLKDTQKCSGLIAVTHSPFIFENSLSQYAHSVDEFIVRG